MKLQTENLLSSIPFILRFNINSKFKLTGRGFHLALHYHWSKKTQSGTFLLKMCQVKCLIKQIITFTDLHLTPLEEFSIEIP